MIPWVLASESPRRQVLLRLLGQPFEIHPACIEERLPPFTAAPSRLAKQLARAKAETIAPAYADALIIAADTLVVLNKQVLGKPETIEEARQMLSLIHI